MLAGIAFLTIMYAGCSYMSKLIFEWWCEQLIDDWEVSDAVALLLAVVWPIGWILMIVVGLACTALITFRAVLSSIVIVVDHLKQVRQGWHK